MSSHCVLLHFLTYLLMWNENYVHLCLLVLGTGKMNGQHSYWQMRHQVVNRLFPSGAKLSSAQLPLLILLLVSWESRGLISSPMSGLFIYFSDNLFSPSLFFSPHVPPPLSLSSSELVYSSLHTSPDLNLFVCVLLRRIIFKMVFEVLVDQWEA